MVNAAVAGGAAHLARLREDEVTAVGFASWTPVVAAPAISPLLADLNPLVVLGRRQPDVLPLAATLAAGTAPRR